MKTILVPIDNSECSIRAIDKARELAKADGSKIILLNVVEFEHVSTFIEGSSVYIDLSQIQDDLIKRSQEILKAAKERCADLGDQVETVSLEGNPAAQIIDYVDNHDIDLVVMGSHGMSGFRRFFIGSVTHKVLVSIEKSILVVR